MYRSLKKSMKGELVLEIDKEGNRWWYRNYQLHREDGPAVEYANGDKVWYLNGVVHRQDGPAVEWSTGYRAWYQGNKLHREDGPAIEWPTGGKAWYLDGKILSQERHEKKVREIVRVQYDS